MSDVRKHPKYVSVAYFKASGKYYTHGGFITSTDFINDGRTANMNAIIDEFKKMCTENDAPGLSGNGEDFYKVINNEEGYPCLLFPGK